MALNNLTITLTKSHYSWDNISSEYPTLLLPVATTKVHRTEKGVLLRGKDITLEIILGRGHLIGGVNCTTVNQMMAEIVQLLVA